MGTVWENIERERLALGWSESELSTRAMGKSSRTHYNITARNGAWGTVQADTTAKYVQALVDAGVEKYRLLIEAGALPGMSKRVPDERRAPRGRGLLSNVRRALLKRYPQKIVDSVVAGSEYLDAADLDELQAFDALDEEIRFVIGMPLAPAQHPKNAPPSDASAKRSAKTPLDAANVSLNDKHETRDLIERTSKRRRG